METLDRLCALLPQDAAKSIREMEGTICEVRLRANRPVLLSDVAGSQRRLGAIAPGALAAIASSLMDHSLYAREAELRQGFFTMSDGCRVGVCGHVVCDGARVTGIASIGSVCVRIAREVRGCADAMMPHVVDASSGMVFPTLILSAPGMGKTTCLRELARRISEAGRRVAIADERREIAACRNGVPTLDVGPCTDVMDGCPKHIAVMHLLRAMSPEVIVSDEIGASEDAQALGEAVRCGAAVITSAHADSLRAALDRPCLAGIIRSGTFLRILVLGDKPGEIRSLHKWPEEGF